MARQLKRQISESVEAHLVRACPQAKADESVGAVLARLRNQTLDNANVVLVVREDGALAGAVPVAKLLSMAVDDSIDRGMDGDFPRVTPETDQERAASLALHHGVDTLAVVDARGRALGIMPPRALLEVLRQEHVEDLHRLVGIQRETAQARHAIEAPPLRRVRHRLPWLLVGLAGSAVATAAMAAMEARLQANVAIAFFVPALVYLADAIGTQTETVAVRGLSLTHTGLAPLLGAELRTGILMGGLLGAISVPFVWFAFSDLQLAAAVGLSIVAAGTLATAIALVFPWLLHRLRFDPAYGSGPASTVVQDVCTILLYFGIVALLQV